MDRRASRGPEYQRITSAEGQEDEVNGAIENVDDGGENGRAILPQENPQYGNEWGER